MSTTIRASWLIGHLLYGVGVAATATLLRRQGSQPQQRLVPAEAS